MYDLTLCGPLDKLHKSVHKSTLLSPSSFGANPLCFMVFAVCCICKSPYSKEAEFSIAECMIPNILKISYEGKLSPYPMLTSIVSDVHQPLRRSLKILGRQFIQALLPTLEQANSITSSVLYMNTFTQRTKGTKTVPLGYYCYKWYPFF